MHTTPRVSVLLALTQLLLLGACGEAGSPCEESCQFAQACTGGEGVGTAGWFGWSCPAVGACGARASCEAQCIINTSCDAVSNTDQAGVSRLRSCMLACAAAGAPEAKDDTPQPISSCLPRCEGRTCGSDGCGGSCGACKSSYLTCDMASGTCQPNTPAHCFQHNECDFPGQIKCTKPDRYRKCYKSNHGCFYWDCDT